MIHYLEGDIFRSPAQVITNAVNTMGVMGKGVALEFKNRYPDMFAAYRTACEQKLLTIGKLMLWQAADYRILLFPTKENWRNPSKIEYIEAGLDKFARAYEGKNIRSVAFPCLGCGNGGLDWEAVRPLMENYLGGLPIPVYVYLKKFEGEAEHNVPKEMEEWLHGNAKDMSFLGLVDEIKRRAALFSFSLEVASETWNVSWKDGLHFSSEDGKQNRIEEEAFFALWDRIRAEGIFSPKNMEEKLVCATLITLGYASPIRLLKSGAQEKLLGCQIDAGAGNRLGWEEAAS